MSLIADTLIQYVLKLLPRLEAAAHEGGHGGHDDRLPGFRQPLGGHQQPAVSDQPAEGVLHHPPPGGILNPAGALPVVVTRQPQCRRTQSLKRRLKPAPGGAGLRGRQQRLHPFPLLVRPVGRVWLPFHGP
jgi:hypothetical protein